VQVADGQEGIDALGERLADADQQAGGERHPRLAREPQRFEARGRRLVG
jgi:hypothetical protein